jgi:NAD(P)-dependent dehydrogenase (short-subunit alcohol dehydrogenase family)
MEQRSIVGIGLQLSRTISAQGDRVALTGRDRGRSEEIVGSIGGDATGLAVDLGNRGVPGETLHVNRATLTT